MAGFVAAISQCLSSATTCWRMLHPAAFSCLIRLPPRTRCGTRCRTTCVRRFWKKRLQLWVIDAYAVAAEAGMGRRINTIMQTCFFAISASCRRTRRSPRSARGRQDLWRKSKRLVELNYRAIDTTLAELHQVTIDETTSQSLSEQTTLAKSLVIQRSREALKLNASSP